MRTARPPSVPRRPRVLRGGVLVAFVVVTSALVGACQMPKPPIPKLPGSDVPEHTASIPQPIRGG